MTPEQNATLKAAVAAEPSLAQAILTGNDAMIAAWLNADAHPAFTTWKTSIPTAAIGTTIGYLALAAMTSANLTQLDMFLSLNKDAFPPSASIRGFFNTTFGGALGGEGQSTRDAMDALYRRNAKRVEKILATGTGSVASPATLAFEGNITVEEAGYLR